MGGVWGWWVYGWVVFVGWWVYGWVVLGAGGFMGGWN